MCRYLSPCPFIILKYFQLKFVVYLGYILTRYRINLVAFDFFCSTNHDSFTILARYDLIKCTKIRSKYFFICYSIILVQIGILNCKNKSRIKGTFVDVQRRVWSLNELRSRIGINQWVSFVQNFYDRTRRGYLDVFLRILVFWSGKIDWKIRGNDFVSVKNEFTIILIKDKCWISGILYIKAVQTGWIHVVFEIERRNILNILLWSSGILCGCIVVVNNNLNGPLLFIFYSIDPFEPFAWALNHFSKGNRIYSYVEFVFDEIKLIKLHRQKRSSSVCCKVVFVGERK